MKTFLLILGTEMSLEYASYLASPFGMEIRIFSSSIITPSSSVSFFSAETPMTLYSLIFFLIYFLFLFIYFWLHWVFIAERKLSLVVASGGYFYCHVQASHCGGFSCCGVWPLGVRASVVVACGLSSCGMRAQ